LYRYPEDVRNVTLSPPYVDPATIPPPPPTFVTNQSACPKVELFFQFDNAPTDQGFELMEYDNLDAFGNQLGIYEYGGPARFPAHINENNTFTYEYEICKVGMFTSRMQLTNAVDP
jgi:hypothetical protein